VDVVGSVIWRVVRPVSPSLFWQALWARGRREGDPAIPLVERLVEPGQVVADVGANFGMFAHRLARQVGPGGHVHVFEPLPQHADALAGLGRRANVTFHAVALSESPGTARLNVPRRDGRVVDAMATLEASGASGEHDVVDVRVATFAQALESEERPLAFVKCDVEGHEHEFLLGARSRLERDRPTLLVEIEQRHRTRPIGETFALLADIGYDGYAIRQGELAPIEQFDAERDQLAHVRATPEGTAMPPVYVNDFLFVSPSRPLPAGVAAAA
jgi:FkbM family methyltransferase